MRYSLVKLTQTEYAEIKALFHSDLPAREIASQYDLAIGVVTSLFRKEYSEEATKERIQKCTKKKKLKTTTATCEECNKEFTLKKIALAQMKKGILCPECKSEKKYKTQEAHFCPVCGLKTHRKQGLALHIKRLAFEKEDQAHLDYFTQEELKKWEGQINGVHYVECQICKEEGKHFSDYRMTTLRRHIPSVHKMTIQDYNLRYPGHSTIAEETEAKRAGAIRDNHNRREPESYNETKPVRCSSCNTFFFIPKYQSKTQHSPLCPTCKKEKLEIEYIAQWKDKVEGVDYVECKIPNCSVDPLLSTEFPFRSPKNLRDHLRFTHDLTLKEYKTQYTSKHYIEDKLEGCGILEHRLKEERNQREDQELLASEVNFCLICKESKEPSELIKNLCLECVGREEDLEGNLYCKFPGCNFKSHYLVSHVTKIHRVTTITYCDQFPGSYFVSSKVRKKMSDRGGWSKGLTKDTDQRVAKISEGREGQSSWNKDLSTENDRRVKLLGESVSQTMSVLGFKHGSTQRKICLSLEDFKPYLDKKGKLLIGKAVKQLKISFPTISREAKNLQLEVSSRFITQTHVMTLLSDILKQPFTSEQTFDSMRNIETNHHFRFDGYFAALDLIVEYHGYQHYLFPNHVHKNIVDFKASQDRDYLKRELAIHNDYFFLVLRFDEPYEDVNFLKSKLKEVFGGTTPWESKNLSKALQKARANIEIPFLL